MDKTENIMFTESGNHSISADSIENYPVSELSSVTNDPDLTIFPSSQCSIHPSDAENTQLCQPNIKDTTNTDFFTDSVAEDPPIQTPLEKDAEVNESLSIIDMLVDSNSADPGSDINIVEKIEPNQKSEKMSQFPLGRVRDIMKADPDIKVVNAECVFLVAKATEMFLQRLGVEIHAITLKNKKKTLQKKDLDTVISENIAFEFLNGALN